MSDQKENLPAPTASDKSTRERNFKMGDRPLARDNPFRAIAQMAAASIGRLPAHLVILFFVALSAAVLCGLVIHYTSSKSVNDSAYLALRLKPDAEKPALADASFTGTWVVEKPPYLFTLRMKNGMFELVIRSSNSPTRRVFVRGGYRFEGNVLVLNQRKDLGAPFEPGHFEITYEPMEFRNINTFVDVDRIKMTWHTPAGEKDRLANSETALQDLFYNESTWTRIGLQP